MIRTGAAAVVIFVAFWSFASGQTSSQPTGLRFELVKIADTDTPVPGGTGTFANLGEISLSAGKFAFRGRDQELRDGIYVGSVSDPATLRAVYDTTTPVPGGIGTFTSFGTPSLSYGKLAFLAGAQGHGGIYTDVSGTLQPLATGNTPIPGGIGNFAGIGTPWLYRGEIVFRASGADEQRGVYTTSGGTLRVVADKNTRIPGSADHFTNFGFGGNAPAIRDGVIVFRGEGSGGQRGVYREVNGTLQVVADRTTPVPGGTGRFISFESNFGHAGHAEGNTVMFVGSGSQGEEGLYASVDGILSVVVDKNTLVPGLPDNFPPLRFTALGQQGFGLHKGNVSFLGQTFLQVQGIYTTLGGSLRNVVANGDLLEGRVSLAFGTYGESLYGNAVAFLVGNFGGGMANFVALLVRDVAIDIKPGGFPNVINPRSRGVIPVAILSETDFDAPHAIEVSSLRFGRQGTEVSLSHCGVEDVNRDGMADLVCQFLTQGAGFMPGDTEAVLTGMTIDEIPLRARDTIRLVGR